VQIDDADGVDGVRIELLAILVNVNQNVKVPPDQIGDRMVRPVFGS